MHTNLPSFWNCQLWSVLCKATCALVRPIIQRSIILKFWLRTGNDNISSPTNAQNQPKMPENQPNIFGCTTEELPHLCSRCLYSSNVKMIGGLILSLFSAIFTFHWFITTNYLIMLLPITTEQRHRLWHFFLPYPLFCHLPSTFPFFISLSFTDEFKSFLKRLPATHFLPVSSVHLLWGSDWDLQARYRLLQSSLESQRLKIQRTARKLFGLSIRCHHNPNHQRPRERWVSVGRSGTHADGDKVTLFSDNRYCCLGQVSSWYGLFSGMKTAKGEILQCKYVKREMQGLGKYTVVGGWVQCSYNVFFWHMYLTRQPDKTRPDNLVVNFEVTIRYVHT